MRRLTYLFFLICLAGAAHVQGQTPISATDCDSPVPTIRTDPDNPVNSERNAGTLVNGMSQPDDMTNHFDWRAQTFSFWNNASWAGKQESITNFFFYTNDPGKNYICRKEFSDFQPADGWELIRADMGIDPNTNQSNETPYPYYILYNKYSGTLRVIAAFTDKGAQHAIKVSLRFMSANDGGTNYAALTPSGLFSTYNTAAIPLDQKTPDNVISSLTNYPGDKRFFYADFHLSYDPCTCNNPSAILISFTSVNECDVQLAGRLQAESDPLGSENNGLWEVDEEKGFLTGLYAPKGTTEEENSESGMLIYEHMGEAVSEMREEAEKTEKKEAIGEGLEIFLTAAEFMAFASEKGSAMAEEAKNTELKEQLEGYSKGLESVALVGDFFKDQMESDGESSPSVINAELSLKGTIHLESSEIMGIELANPGSLNSNTRLSYRDGTNAMPLYPTYNLPLGVFGLLSQPQAEFNEQTQSPYGSEVTIEPGLAYYKASWHLSDPVQFVFNPILNINYDASYVKGAWVIEGLPNAPILADVMLNLEEVYETTEPGSSAKIVYASPFKDLDDLSLTVPVLEYLHAFSWYRPQHKVYLKLIVYIQYNDLNDAGMPFYTSNVLKYEVKQNAVSQDLSGIPHTYNSPYTSNSPVNSTQYGPLTLGETTYVTTNTSGYITGQVQNIYVMNDITIDGDQMLGSGVTQVNITSGKEIIQDCESVIDCEIILQPANSGMAAVASPPVTDLSWIKNYYCPDNTKYRANQTAERQGADLQASLSDHATEIDKLSLDIYPNPISNNGAQLRYTVPQGDKVNIYISGMLGEKVMELVNYYQSAGDYQITIPAGLPEGIYFCTIQAAGGIVTKRIEVMK